MELRILITAVASNDCPIMVTVMLNPKDYYRSLTSQHIGQFFSNYTVFRKKTPTHIFFHISMSDV